MSLEIYSPAFEPHQPIPVRFTADGPDLSPPLIWKGVPEDARSLVIICDDPDAPMGTWVHWVIFNLPPELAEIPEDVPPDPEPSVGGIQGKNDFGRIGYGGPSPPPGKPHRYFFKLYALDSYLALNWEAVKADVVRAMEDHILDEVELVGTYQR